MNDDIVNLLQDLSRDAAVDVVANFMLQNPETEELIAAKIGSLLSNPATANIPSAPQQPEATNTSMQPSSFLNDLILSSGLSGVLGCSYKMIFVVNMELNMGRGKQCAQVAHAALGLFLKVQESRKQDDINRLQQWISMGQKKIVVKANNLKEMMELKEAATRVNLPNLLVSDAGCTQIAPGSKTVLSIFGTNEQLDPITGSLRLL